jgi:hypothetical protein
MKFRLIKYIPHSTAFAVMSITILENRNVTISFVICKIVGTLLKHRYFKNGVIAETVILHKTVITVVRYIRF